jgi:hypothetical protein
MPTNLYRFLEALAALAEVPEFWIPPIGFTIATLAVLTTRHRARLINFIYLIFLRKSDII